MGIMNNITDHALFINGVFESVFVEIIKSDQINPGSTFYLQPYSGHVIKELKDNPPERKFPLTLYASTTDHLNKINYMAEIVGWEHKQELFKEENRERKEFIESQLNQYQPNEGGLYRSVNGKNCVNLISIVNLRKLSEPIQVGSIFKISDGKSLKTRSRAGGWSYVYVPDSTTASGFVLKSNFDEKFNKSVSLSLSDNDQLRKIRLESASKFPTKTAVVSYVFNRNCDVVAEVLKRSDGKCELCKKDAPFNRASDGTRYLEVHHWVPLSEGGEDTVENATALCPNCHKQSHFGQNKGYIKMQKKLPG